MIKRMKKILAIAAVCALTLSMGPAVFAAESPVDPEIPDIEGPEKPETPDTEKPAEPQDIVTGSGYDKDGNRLTIQSVQEVTEEVKEMLQDDEKVKDILEGAGYVPKDDQDVVVLGMGDISIEGEMPEGGLDVEISLEEQVAEGLKDGDTVYVLHQKHDGTWEVLEGTVTVDEFGNTNVTAHFDSLSPVAIIKVMSNGETVIMDKDETNKQPITPPSQEDNKTDNKADNKADNKDTTAKAETNNGVKLSPKTGK